MLKTVYYKDLSGTYFVQTYFNGMYQGFSYDCIPSDYLSCSSTKTYVVGNQKNHLNETGFFKDQIIG